MFIIVMGVSGSGKTTISRMLTEKLGWPFYDGDVFHPLANVAKMASGVPLTDEDRAGWLDALATLIKNRSGEGENAVLACSALKTAYRDVLSRPDRNLVRFVYLKGSYEVILARMQSRSSHFMKSEMLKSQFAALQEPLDALTLDVSLSPNQIIQKIIDANLIVQ